MDSVYRALDNLVPFPMESIHFDLAFSYKSLVLLCLAGYFLLKLDQRKRRKVRSDTSARIFHFPLRMVQRQQNHAIGKRPRLPLLCQKTFMDDYERQFYLRLVKALPECYVFPQVSFSAFLNSSNKWDRRYEVRGRFNRLVADFILCDCESFRLLAVIELDGNSHDRKDVQEKDKKRDAYLDEAGIKHKRFRAPPQPSEEEIKGWFQRVIQN